MVDIAALNLRMLFGMKPGTRIHAVTLQECKGCNGPYGCIGTQDLAGIGLLGFRQRCCDAVTI